MEERHRRAAYGDFQTPIALSREVCALIARTGFRPASIIEPTCGMGSFLQASLETFPEASYVLGFEINPEYVQHARDTIARITSPGIRAEVRQSDFFLTDWSRIVEGLPEPILVIGNPPWATNTMLSVLGSGNLPNKSNLDRLRGIDALTGRSNFDISEWMLRENLGWLNGKDGLLAMLCKTAVARKVLAYAWRRGLTIASASLYHLDTRVSFGVAVEACLLLLRTQSSAHSRECQVYDSLDAEQPAGLFGWRDGRLVADVHLYEKWKAMVGTGLKGWRSGIKHDSSRVFELRREGGKLVNGFGEQVDVEPEVLFPLLKSSDLAARRTPRRWLIVPQRTVGEDTRRLEVEAPKAWRYLMAYASLLDQRKSSVYKNRARFSVFGVGPYSFAPWKVAISGLYKELDFVCVPPFQGRPVVLDDTCYFFPCQSREECRVLHELMMSDPAQEFLSAFIFWDAKRPITAGVLNLLNLEKLARMLGKESDVVQVLATRQIAQYGARAYQLSLPL